LFVNLTDNINVAHNGIIHPLVYISFLSSDEIHHKIYKETPPIGGYHHFVVRSDLRNAKKPLRQTTATTQRTYEAGNQPLPPPDENRP